MPSHGASLGHQEPLLFLQLQLFLTLWLFLQQLDAPDPARQELHQIISRLHQPSVMCD